MRADAKERFVTFFGQASPRLLTTAWLLTADPHRAEELVQETMTRVYSRWRKIRAGEELAYARRTMANLHTDTWRKRRREVLRSQAPEGAPVDEHDQRRQQRSDVASSHHIDLVRALQEIPARERQVVVLRYYADMSEQAVADALDVSLGTIKSSASRGLAKLREVMTEGEESNVAF